MSRNIDHLSTSFVAQFPTGTTGDSHGRTTPIASRPMDQLRRLESNRFLSSASSKRLSSLNSKSRDYDDTPVRLTKLALAFPTVLITSSLHLSISLGGLSKYQHILPPICNLMLLAFPFFYGEKYFMSAWVLPYSMLFTF